MDEEVAYQPLRLDQYVVKQLPELSRAYIQKLCEQGRILVNGKVERPSYKVKISDEVKVDYSPEDLSVIPDIDLPILYEDEHCVVINKPEGVLTHGKGAFDPEATVGTFMRRYVLGGDNRAGIVHRLDRATSGVILCAKSSEMLAFFQKQFSQRKVKKTYVAIVDGHLKPEEAIIDMPIERNPQKPQSFRVGAGGRAARTHYKVTMSVNGYDMIDLTPTTGRTHQLRVHMRQLGHPIVGDYLYGGSEAKRMYLHAKSLEITLPGGERKVFTSPVPESFATFMKRATRD